MKPYNSVAYEYKTNTEINLTIGYKSISQQQFIQFVLLFHNNLHVNQKFRAHHYL